MNRTDTVLFDFDGTIMDTTDIILMSWQHTFRSIAGREEDEKVLFATFGEPLEDTMRKFFPDFPVEEGLDIYRTFHRKYFSDYIKLCPGTEEILKEVKDMGLRTAVVTSRLLITTDRGLKKFGIEKYFDTVITAEDTKAHKPDPEPINIALSRLGSEPSRAMMVGDTLFDIMCAKNAGVTSVFAGWSDAIRSEEDLMGVVPDYTIERFSDLGDIIRKRNVKNASFDF